MMADAITAGALVSSYNESVVFFEETDVPGLLAAAAGLIDVSVPELGGSCQDCLDNTPFDSQSSQLTLV